MPRLLRFIPEGGALVEVTTRTLQGRLLLTPRPLLNRIIIGALARASQRHGVRVVADRAPTGRQVIREGGHSNELEEKCKVREGLSVL